MSEEEKFIIYIYIYTKERLYKNINKIIQLIKQRLTHRKK